MFKFITHKSFFINFLAVIVLILLLLFIFFGSLDFLTRHNKVQHVPYVVGQNLDAATKLLEANGFVVAVKDSVYIDTSAPLAVVRQSPEADAVVKVHRTVYLTINRAVAPLVEMPDLRGFSVKSAQLYLQSLGLRMGDTIYKPDIAKSAVKEQKLNGKDIPPGTKINMGSAIDLVIGSGLGDQAMNVPDLTGMTLADARIYLSNKSISLGSVIIQGAVDNQEAAFIVQQHPLPYSTIAPGQVVANKIAPGQLMDVWISNTAPQKDTLPNVIPNQ